MLADCGRSLRFAQRSALRDEVSFRCACAKVCFRETELGGNGPLSQCQKPLSVARDDGSRGQISKIILQWDEPYQRRGRVRQPDRLTQTCRVYFGIALKFQRLAGDAEWRRPVSMPISAHR